MTVPLAPSIPTTGHDRMLVPPLRLLAQGTALEVGSEAVVVIGRDPACHLVLEDPVVSRRHARIVAVSAGVVVEDLGSTNGVYVNGARIQQRTRLHVGDRILVGTTELSVFTK